MLLEVSIFDDMVEKGTPLPGNSCKECGGRVVKTVRSMYQGRYYYSPPLCEGCGKQYTFAKNVPTAGEKEFAATLQQPFTI